MGQEGEGTGTVAQRKRTQHGHQGAHAGTACHNRVTSTASAPADNFETTCSWTKLTPLPT